jgi:hypothetical protein
MTYEETSIVFESNQSLSFTMFNNQSCYFNPFLTSIWFKSSEIVRLSNAINCHNLFKVTLIDCHYITSLEGLSMVTNLEISACWKLANLSGLLPTSKSKESDQQAPQRQIKTISIGLCPLITDFSPLQGINKVGIYHCDGLKDISNLKQIQHLVIHGCSNLKHFHLTERHGLTKIELKQFNGLETVYGLWGVQDVTLIASYCTSFSAVNWFHPPNASKAEGKGAQDRFVNQKITFSNGLYHSIISEGDQQSLNRAFFEGKYNIDFKGEEIVQDYDHFYTHLFRQSPVALVKLVRRNEDDPKSIAFDNLSSQLISNAVAYGRRVKANGKSEVLSVIVITASSIVMAFGAFLFYYFYHNNKLS